MRCVGRDVLHALGQHQEGGLLEISLDGKHLKGSARGGVRGKAIVLVSAYLSRLQSKAAQSLAALRNLLLGFLRLLSYTPH
ncbi:hypothetical protein [Meiothermus cerbereus]|uniref:hypothetical protein n=1 Tax=Meiothermus cerbereus TaxID=65552 RepID=UPI001B8080B8|nr:hypothetical protein [Meiothermus cerbereus]